MILRGKRRRIAESIARKNWERARTQHSLSPNQRRAYAIRWAEEELILHRRQFGDNGFGSVVTSVLFSLALKLIVKRITRWLEEEYLDGKH